MPSLTLVLGASSRLGREVAAALVQRGHAVRGASRHPGHIPTPAIPIRADLLDPASLHNACRGVDTVVMAAGAPVALRLTPGHPGYRAVDHQGTLNLLAAARDEGVRRFVYVSEFAPAGFDGGPYVQAHRDAAEAVRRSELDHAVVQPTGFFSTFDAFLPLARLGVMPEIGDGTARTNPIHERDLAAVVAGAVEGEAGADLPVGGPETLTRREIAEAAFAAVGRRPRFVRAPDAVLRLNRRLVGPVDRRLGELLTFLDAVSRVDAVAPPAGSFRLADYLTERARA